MSEQKTTEELVDDFAQAIIEYPLAYQRKDGLGVDNAQKVFAKSFREIQKRDKTLSPLVNLMEAHGNDYLRRTCARFLLDINEVKSLKVLDEIATKNTTESPKAQKIAQVWRENKQRTEKRFRNYKLIIGLIVIVSSLDVFSHVYRQIYYAKNPVIQENPVGTIVQGQVYDVNDATGTALYSRVDGHLLAQGESVDSVKKTNSARSPTRHLFNALIMLCGTLWLYTRKDTYGYFIAIFYFTAELLTGLLYFGLDVAKIYIEMVTIRHVMFSGFSELFVVILSISALFVLIKNGDFHPIVRIKYIGKEIKKISQFKNYFKE